MQPKQMKCVIMEAAPYGAYFFSDSYFSAMMVLDGSREYFLTTQTYSGRTTISIDIILSISPGGGSIPPVIKTGFPKKYVVNAPFPNQMVNYDINAPINRWSIVPAAQQSAPPPSTPRVGERLTSSERRLVSQYPSLTIPFRPRTEGETTFTYLKAARDEIISRMRSNTAVAMANLAATVPPPVAMSKSDDPDRRNGVSGAISGAASVGASAQAPPAQAAPPTPQFQLGDLFRASGMLYLITNVELTQTEVKYRLINSDGTEINVREPRLNQPIFKPIPRVLASSHDLSQFDISQTTRDRIVQSRAHRYNQGWVSRPASKTETQQIATKTDDSLIPPPAPRRTNRTRSSAGEQPRMDGILVRSSNVGSYRPNRSRRRLAMDVDSAFGPRNVRPRATGPTIVDHVNNNTNVEWSSERDSLLAQGDTPILFRYADNLTTQRPHPRHPGYFSDRGYPFYIVGDVIEDLNSRTIFVVLGGNLSGEYQYVLYGSDGSLHRFSQSQLRVGTLYERLPRDQNEINYRRLIARFNLSEQWISTMWEARALHNFQMDELFLRGMEGEDFRAPDETDDALVIQTHIGEFLSEQRRRSDVFTAHGDKFWKRKALEKDAETGNANAILRRDEYVALEGKKQKQLGQAAINAKAEAWWKVAEDEAAVEQAVQQSTPTRPDDLPFDGKIILAIAEKKRKDKELEQVKGKLTAEEFNQRKSANAEPLNKLLSPDYLPFVTWPYQNDDIDISWNKAILERDRAALFAIQQIKAARQRNTTSRPVSVNGHVCSLCSEGFDASGRKIVPHKKTAQQSSTVSGGYAVQLRCGHWFHSECIRQFQFPEVSPEQFQNYETPEGDTVTSDHPRALLRRWVKLKDTQICPMCIQPTLDNSFGDGIYRLRDIKLRF